MRFRDHVHAGQLLADRLTLDLHPPLVVGGIPTRGMVLARIVAARFGMPLAVAHVHRLTVAPNSDVAFGALDERGNAVLLPDFVRSLHLTLADLEHARTRAMRELHRRAACFHDMLSVRDMAPKHHVLLVDEGVTSGYTMLAAIRAAQRMAAARVTVAVPCGAPAALHMLEDEADEVICLDRTPGFVSIREHYDRFDPAIPTPGRRGLPVPSGVTDREPAHAGPPGRA